MFKIVMGTSNAKKIGELNDIFAGEQIELLPLADLFHAIEVEETGTTFQENARLKATVQAQHLNRWVLAEDSGLSVRALGGKPGVHSARYSGEPRDDHRNNQRLLENLREIPLAGRDAWYTCHMILSNPAGEPVIDCSGECHGRILMDYFGSDGFGYDPLFEVVEYHQTFGQLGLAVKSLISHRARAARKFLRHFRRLQAAGAIPKGN